MFGNDQPTHSNHKLIKLSMLYTYLYSYSKQYTEYTL